MTHEEAQCLVRSKERQGGGSKLKTHTEEANKMTGTSEEPYEEAFHKARESCPESTGKKLITRGT